MRDDKKITAHMIVKNEDQWIYYSILSILDYVDKILIFDTGSVDNTVNIIKEIMQVYDSDKKIVFEEKGSVTSEEFYLLRQEQIELTNTEYFMVVDGDEVWYKESLLEIHKIINAESVYLIASKFINCAGDIYHYRRFDREQYQINDVLGSITIRVYSMNISGIHCSGIYGVEGYYDAYNKPVQESCWDIKVQEGKYLHMSFLPRSSSINGDISIAYRRKKFGASWDCKFDENFKYPEVLYQKPSKYLSSPWVRKITTMQYVLCFIRKLIRG